MFVGVTTIFFCFPGTLPVGTNSMNYVSGVIGIFLVLLTAYWFVYGTRFEGPVSARLISFCEYTADVARRNSMLSWVSLMRRERLYVRMENTLKESGRVSRLSRTR
jgi:hypothetical protein